MTRILITAAAGCILTGGIGYLLLPVLRALKAGQSIREIGPTWHNSKAGTPMMGGLMFIFGTILCLVGNFPAMSDDSPFYVLALALCFGLIGFLDDFTKVKFHRNLGLTTLQKAMLQMAVSALFLYAMYRSGFMDTHLYIPFANVSFQLHPIVYIFFAMFVMVGTDNAVNLTDGVDGLCASITLPVMIFFTAAAAAFAREIEASPFPVCLHWRCGDYLLPQNAALQVCTPEYYAAACRMVRQSLPQAELFVFSDDPAYVRQHLDAAGLPVHYSTGAKSAAADLALMRRCRAFVLSNSTFSWAPLPFTSALTKKYLPSNESFSVVR